MQPNRVSKLAALIITYNPNIERLRKNIKAVMEQVSLVLLVDNASHNSHDISYLSEQTKTKAVFQIENVGLAKALNIGMKYLREHGFEWVITLDQDSVVASNLVMELYDCSIMHDRCAISCPDIIYEGWSKKHVKNRSTYDAITACMTSASMTSVKAWEEVSGFDESYFIDFVDNEFCMKLRLAGYQIIRNHSVSMSHMLGDSGELKCGPIRFKYSHHSPLRYYYMVRNNIVFVEKYKKHLNYPKELIKILYNICVGILVEHDKETLYYIAVGIKDAKRKKMGRFN